MVEEYALSTYEVDPSYGTAIRAATDNARAIVRSYAGASDYDKLEGYRDRICALTDYNHAAVADSQTPYGNPWQLIWVFDGDASTKVVCEGYSKAFQYLCDLSDFQSWLLTAYSVTGTMNGGSHMWNIVTMENGKNYLVDVTNYDSGFTDLFLAGYASGSPSDGYGVRARSSTIRYVYDTDMFDIFSTAELTLSGRSYREDLADPDPTPTPTPGPVGDLFTDVTDDSLYFYAPVYWARDNGITTGKTATTFAPYESCTRGQIVTFLWRMMGCPAPTSTYNPFTDVREGDYFRDAVLWAREKGITTGKTATTFAPNAPCTRGQCVTFLWRTAGQPEPVSTYNPFKDVKRDDFYYSAVLWAAVNGITTGKNATTFAPNEACTRGQTVTFLYRCSALG